MQTILFCKKNIYVYIYTCLYFFVRSEWGEKKFFLSLKRKFFCLKGKDIHIHVYAVVPGTFSLWRSK